MTALDAHPTTAEIDALLLGKLDDSAEARLAAHLDDCPCCLARASQTQSDTFTSLLASASTDAVTPPPELARHPKYRVLRLLVSTIGFLT